MSTLYVGLLPLPGLRSALLRHRLSRRKYKDTPTFHDFHLKLWKSSAWEAPRARLTSRGLSHRGVSPPFEPRPRRVVFGFSRTALASGIHLENGLAQACWRADHAIVSSVARDVAPSRRGPSPFLAENMRPVDRAANVVLLALEIAGDLIRDGKTGQRLL